MSRGMRGGEGKAPSFQHAQQAKRPRQAMLRSMHVTCHTCSLLGTCMLVILSAEWLL